MKSKNLLYLVLNYKSTSLRFACAACAALALGSIAGAKGLTRNADVLQSELSEMKQIPALPEGVTELKFDDFFKKPVGDRGMEFTAKVRELDGKRVRILGFMVRQTKSAPGVLLLAPFRFTTDEAEFGMCDDLPPSTLTVEVSKYRDLAVPYTPGLLLLTGTLSLGYHQEADGRVSHIRMQLDPESASELSGPAAPVANLTR